MHVHGAVYQAGLLDFVFCSKRVSDKRSALFGECRCAFRAHRPFTHDASCRRIPLVAQFASRGFRGASASSSWQCPISAGSHYSNTTRRNERAECDDKCIVLPVDRARGKTRLHPSAKWCERVPAEEVLSCPSFLIMCGLNRSLDGNGFCLLPNTLDSDPLQSSGARVAPRQRLLYLSLRMDPR